jgi:hypothetical protein
MKMRTFVGLCAALAFAAGSTAVQALKIDMGISDSNEGRRVVYAKETLLTTQTEDANDADDNTTYYKISRGHTLTVPYLVSASATDTYLVSIDLTGMVFWAPIGAATDLTRQDGGLAGDNYVLLRNTAAISSTDENGDPRVFTLTDVMFAVSGNGGRIDIEAVNHTLETIDVGRAKTRDSESLSGAVTVKSALDEDFTPNEMTPTAQAAENFMTFASGSTTAMIGSVVLNVVEPHLRQAQAAVNVEELDHITGIAPAAGTAAAPANPVTFSISTGDLSFVDTLWVGEEDCATTGNEIRIESDEMDEDGNPILTSEVMPQDANVLDGDPGPSYLCASVDGMTAIPKSTFTVTTMYEGLDGAAFKPMGSDDALVGKIDRDGTTFRIPYLTTYSGYTQRIVIVNRGRATTYNFGEFESEAGVTVLDGPKASGELPMGTTVLFSTDVVEIIGGRTRAAGTLSIVADPSTIDAAIQQVTIMGGNVDTVYLTTEP